MPTPPNATASTPVTAVRLAAPLKARITAAQAELAREMPGLTPTFSDTVRVLINEALAARAVASPTDTLAAARASAHARAVNDAAIAAYDAAYAAREAALDDAYAAHAADDDDDALAAAKLNYLADIDDLAPVASRAAAVPGRPGRGAGGITLHRATNGASVATVVANDPK